VVVLAVVRSVNAGPVATLPGVRARTGIRKSPRPRIEVRDPGPRQGGLGSGVVGDGIGSRRHHGGTAQAVYAFAREELDRWSHELGRPLEDGLFGENLTTLGLEVDDAVTGERWRVGTALLEVTGPRVPCATFAGRMGEPGWVRRFADHGRTGAYLAVVEAGVVEPGDPVEVESRPDHGVTVPMLFRAGMGDRALGREILDAAPLHPVTREWLEGRAGRQSPAYTTR
jgi:MOSC domain-containing protein YiiM